MKPFRKDPYPNPINIDRHPELASLDNELRREAIGLPVKRSAEDNQFLDKMGAWLKNETDRKESDRILAEVEQKQQRQEVNQSKRILGKERPRDFNHYLAILREERKQREYDDDYEDEQAYREQKWLQHNLQYKA